MARPSRLELGVWAITTGAARHVTDPVRFALNELFLRQRARRYRLRRSGRAIHVRHPLADALVVEEVLGSRHYEPPAAVVATLGSGPLRIADLGGHVGSATLAFLERFPGSTVEVFEPHPDSARLLWATIDANDLAGQVTLVPAAVGVAPGSLRMEGHSVLAHAERDEAEAIDAVPFIRSHHPEPAPFTAEVVDVLPRLKDADLVKIDIEGAEWPLLADSRLADVSIRALILEYHRQGAPRADAAGAARELLTAAGFTVGEPFDVQPETGLLWAWKP